MTTIFMAKRMNELIKELKILKEKELEYQFLKDFSCKTEEEFEAFQKENTVELSRLKIIKKRIEEIELKLMSGEEKEIHRQYLNDLKEKFKDEQ